MDFALTDEQEAIRALAERILTDGASHERQRVIERAGGPRFDADLWRQLGEAGLVGVATSAEHGGTGLGFLELALVIEQIGRHVAPVPLWETAVLGGMPIDRFGSDAQRRAWLPALASGERIWTAALETLAGEEPLRATRTKGGWRVAGARTCVPAGQAAHHALVLAGTGEGATVLAVDLEAPGVRRVPLATTSGAPDARLELADVAVGADAVLGAPGTGAEIASWIRERADAALAALALGVCEEALRLTADYVKERKQFGQPIAMFQAVAHRAADAYVDVEAVRLTAWQAACRLAAGEAATAEVALAKYWAAEGGHRVVHAAQHLHGGVGVDRDYPLHRYFLEARHVMLTLGGPTEQLLRIGRVLAEQPAE